MKHLCVVMLLLISFAVKSQIESKYVCFSTGLNMRDKPNLQAKVLGKIPYATKLQINRQKIDTVPVTVENMVGYWTPVTFQGKTGYILNCYLVSIVPPKKGTENMQAYLKQITTPVGPLVKVGKGNMHSITENGYEMKKQLYKNAAAWHNMTAYEYSADAYYLPEINVQEAFLIVRQIKEFEEMFTEKDQMPIKNETSELKKIKIDAEPFGNDKWIKKIEVESNMGPHHVLTIESLDTGEVVIKQTFAV